jgi:hypothetical protein
MKTTASVIIGIAIIVSSIVFGIFFYQSKQTQQTVQVIGFAGKDFESDIVKWTVSLSVRVGLTDLPEGYERLAKELNLFRDIWASAGIPSTEFKVFPVSVMDEYGNGQKNGYLVEQRIYIVSNAIDEIEKIAVNPELFVKKGLAFNSSQIEFFSSAIDAIKVDLLSQATQNARERAAKIIETTDMKIDKLISAKAGVFQITEPLSTEVAGYGIYDTSSRRKNIKVTVSAVFSLK